MKQFTVSIQDDKTKLFLEILNELSFVENIEAISTEVISEEHKNIVRERIAKYRVNNYKDWTTLDVDLDKK